MGKGAKKAERGQAENAQTLLPLAALAFTLRRGLREFVVESGMRALGELLEQERTELCGPRYKHEPERAAHRAGHAVGELAMGGRRVQVRRPRARTDERELELPTWRQFSSEDPLHARALEEMVIGVSTRKYRRALEELPTEVKERGTSKSAVSRRFVAATQKELATWLGRDLGGIDLAVVMIDGLAFGDERVVLIALGIDTSGKKHVLGIHEGATENATACGALLDDIIARGVATKRSKLFVVDGSKALVKAIRDRFGERALIQRCQVHKKRNVRDHLPEYMRSSVSATMSQAYQTRDAVRATKLLENLARSLDGEHPSAAASLREGLAETLTVVRLGLSQQLCRILSTTNAIENLNSTARDVCRRVKHWRSGEMILRWTCAAMREAESKFRRVQGFKGGMPLLLNALQRNDERIDGRLTKQTRPNNHAGVYRAIIETVLSGSDPQWRDYRREALEAMTTEALMQSALPLPDSQELYGALSLEQLHELRPELIGVLAFKQWPEHLQARGCSDQFYSKKDLEKALEITKHWRRHPRLAAVVDEIAATSDVFDD